MATMVLASIASATETGSLDAFGTFKATDIVDNNTAEEPVFLPGNGTEAAPRVYDHDVTLEYKYGKLITMGFNAEIWHGDDKIFTIQKKFYEGLSHWKWNITDLTGQTVMIVKGTGILVANFEIERLVDGTTNQFEKIYDAYPTSVLHRFRYDFDAVPNSGLQDVRAVRKFSAVRFVYDIQYRESREKIGKYKDGILHRGCWLNVNAGQDIVEVVAMGMIMEYIMEGYKY